MQKISDLRAEIRKMIQFGQFDFLEFFSDFSKKKRAGYFVWKST